MMPEFRNQRGPGGGGGDGGPQRNPPTTPRLSDVLREVEQKGYFDEKNILRPQVIQDWPKIAADDFKGGGLTSTQLRRFFTKAKAIEQKLKSGQSFDRLREEIHTLKPLAAAAVGKRNAPEIFNMFMEVHVHQALKSPEAFTRGFIIHLQSIIAYTKYFEETKTKGGR